MLFSAPQIFFGVTIVFGVNFVFFGVVFFGGTIVFFVDAADAVLDFVTFFCGVTTVFVATVLVTDFFATVFVVTLLVIVTDFFGVASDIFGVFGAVFVGTTVCIDATIGSIGVTARSSVSAPTYSSGPK